MQMDALISVVVGGVITILLAIFAAAQRSEHRTTSTEEKVDNVGKLVVDLKTDVTNEFTRVRAQVNRVEEDQKDLKTNMHRLETETLQRLLDMERKKNDKD